MPIRLWGAASEITMGMPRGMFAYALLAFELLAVVYLIYRYRHPLRALSPRQMAAVAGLSLAALLTSQLFAVDLPWRNPVLNAQPDLMAVSLLAAVPWLLAGAAFNPGVALLVGLFAGLGRALGQTHSPLDVTAVALAAWFAGWLLHQNFNGKLFYWLRQPVIAGPLAAVPLSLLIGLKVFGGVLPLGGWLAALDLALYTAFAALLPLALEGLVSGAVVNAVLHAAPAIRPKRGAVPSPLSTSLQRYMLANFLGFAVALAIISAGIVFYLSTRTLSRTAVQQMAYTADAAAAGIPALQADLANVLVQYSGDVRLVEGGAPERDKALNQLSRSAPQFGDVLLVTSGGSVSSAGEEVASLTDAESQAVSAALAAGKPELAAGRTTGGTAFSLVVPVEGSASGTAALVGRVPETKLGELLAAVPGPSGRGSGYVVNGSSQIILRAGEGPSGDAWQPPISSATLPFVPAGARGTAYEALDGQTGVRRLIYYTPVPGSNWRVVASLPYEVILSQALGVIAPVAGLLAIVSLLFFASVTAFGRSVTRPLAELAETSKAIAGGGGLEKSVRVPRDDELGQLSLAFGQMQRSLKQRLEELNLLLTVSNEVAASINISQGMPAVLQGMLRGTGAAGARAVVRNPNASYPLIFSEGPGGETMAVFDRVVMTLARRAEELALSSPQEVAETLGIENPSIAALYAIPLKSSNEYQGAIYLGYRQPHYFDSWERNLLRTLAGQAAVLVQNAHLFSAAESGRKRLQAILTSTTNAVIVTDQTDRVLLVNPAMERAFSLDKNEAAGRPVSDVVKPESLAGRLRISGVKNGEEAAADGKVEIDAGGRTFLANIATVYSSNGQAMGRVAVLHDVTDFKELDRMKSDFLAGISHDLLSPLTYMRNYASSLPLQEDRELEREYIEKIMGGIDRMTHMVNDLLDLGRIEARINLKIQSISVPDLLDDIKHEYWAHAKMNGLNLIVVAPASLPPVQGDPGLLRRAITNLISNAIKYAPNSGDLLLSAAVQGKELAITVRDHGPGIPAIEMPQLFERFHRAREARRKVKVTGSGLGLAIVKSIAEQHGGRVACASEEGKGSAFSILLPL